MASNRTPEELEAFNIHRTQLQADEIALKEARDAELVQKATDKTNGNQKLLDLGLTQAEVDAITGQ